MVNQEQIAKAIRNQFCGHERRDKADGAPEALESGIFAFDLAFRKNRAYALLRNPLAEVQSGSRAIPSDVVSTNARGIRSGWDQDADNTIQAVQLRHEHIPAMANAGMLNKTVVRKGMELLISQERVETGTSASRTHFPQEGCKGKLCRHHKSDGHD